MASRFYSLTFVALTGILGMVSPPDLYFGTAQAQTTQNRFAEVQEKINPLLKQGENQIKTSDFEAALESFQQALTIFREIKSCKFDSKIIDSPSVVLDKKVCKVLFEGDILARIGSLYNTLGKYDKAVEYHTQALSIAREVKGGYFEALQLSDLAVDYHMLAKYDKAIEYYLQALSIFSHIDRSNKAVVLGNLANTYNALGKYDKAIEYELQALPIFREIKDRNNEAVSLNHLGDYYNALGKYDKAIEYDLQALDISREIRDKENEVATLISLVNTYNTISKYDKAIEYALQALEIARGIKVRRSEGAALNNLGEAYNALNKYDKAIEDELQALAIAREIKNRYGEGNALNNIGDTFAKQSKPELAILFYKQSVTVRESIRKDIRGLDKDLQKSYLSTVEKTYRNLANLLIEQGRIVEALQVLDLLKVQELEDYLKNIKGNDRTSQGVQLLEPEKAISNELSSLKFDKIPELNNKLKNQIQQLPKSEINKVPEYLQKLPQGEVLIYPLILDDRLEIIVFSTNTTPINRTVTIKKTELEDLVLTLRVELQDSSSLEYKTTSKKLYDILIKPIEADLKQANANTIIYAPDGILRYIPLAALYDGKQYLIENYAITNPIAYILTDFTPKAKTQPSILAGAFGGKQGEKRYGQEGLPSTLTEVSEITKLIQNSTALSENSFSRQAIETQLDKHNILHLATHAEFNTGTPDNSFIIFGNGDTIRLSEIPELKLKDIDLIVLSACQTAVGSLGSGVEILGFGYQVQKAGAKSAIASLWKVSDEGTQTLMKSFYENIKRENFSKAETLRQAQIAIIHSKNFSHPYYWSAFILIGNGL